MTSLNPPTFLLVIIILSTTARATSGAGPSTSESYKDLESILPDPREVPDDLSDEPQDPQTDPELNTQLLELLRRCFDPESIQANGYPSKAEFTVSARDEFRDVDLTFAVFGDEDKCKLEWDSWLVPVGRIRSVHHDTGEPVQKRAMKIDPLDFEHHGISLVSQISGVTFEIYNKDPPHWELTNWHTNNLVSLKFMYSFVSAGLRAHTRFCGEPVYLRMVDMSPYREFGWLMKDKGRTLFEYGWNMEYECLIERMNSAIRDQLYEYGRHVGNVPAGNAMRDRTFGPIMNAMSWQNPQRPYSQAFMVEIRDWLRANSIPIQGVFAMGQGVVPQQTRLLQLARMPSKVVARDFISHWRTKGYDLQTSIGLAQGTFTYFYRNAPNFDLLARQVLSGYDDSCYMMKGIPYDESPYAFTFTYTATPSPHPEPFQSAAFMPPGDPTSDFSELVQLEPAIDPRAQALPPRPANLPSPTTGSAGSSSAISPLGSAGSPLPQALQQGMQSSGLSPVLMQQGVIQVPQQGVIQDPQQGVIQPPQGNEPAQDSGGSDSSGSSVDRMVSGFFANVNDNE